MKRSLAVSSLLKCHLQRLFHHFSPGWFVCCRPSPRESWNYRFPSAELGKHLFSDRNGSRYWLKPVTKKGARWETMYFNSSFTFHFIWQTCFTDAPADFGLHRLRRYSDHSPVWFIFFFIYLFILIFINFSRNFWVFPFQAKKLIQPYLAIKSKICHVGWARAKTHIKTILLRISKLCQLRTASNEPLHVIAQISQTATVMICQLNTNFKKKSFFSPYFKWFKID